MKVFLIYQINDRKEEIIAVCTTKELAEHYVEDNPLSFVTSKAEIKEMNVIESDKYERSQ